MDAGGNEQQEDQEEEQGKDLPPVRLTLANIKSLTTLLQAMKISAKQVCACKLALPGLATEVVGGGLGGRVSF